VGTGGRHWLVEYQRCSPGVLDHPEDLRSLLRRAAEAAGAQVVGEACQPFAPHGVSIVLLIEESHFSLHTWPEQRYAAVDFYTCGQCRPEEAHAVLLAGLEAERCELLVVQRGLLGAPRAIAYDVSE
jgi:S-adenosylmethionine decarboxylase proenzyme